MGIIPLLLFAVVLIHIFTKQQEGTIHQYLLESAGHASHNVDQAIGEQIGLLYGLAASRSLDTGNFDSFRVNAQRIIAVHPEWRTVIVTDENKPVFNLRFQPGQKITPLRDPQSLKRVWQTQKPYVGDLSNGFVAIRAPVIREGQIRYTLVVPVEPRFFLEAASSSLQANAWGYIIIGGDGKVIAASATAPAKSGAMLPQQYLSGDSSAILSVDDMIYTPPSPVKAGGWQLILFAPESTITAPFVKARLLVYGGGLLAATLTIILVLAIGSAWAARHEAIGLHEEMTMRLKAEDDLRQTEISLKEAQRLTEIGSWKWDLVADRHIWSEEVYRIYGRDLRLPPAVYPEVKEYFTPESWARLAAVVEEGINSGASYQCDAEVIRPDGSHRWILARGEAIRDDDGRISALRGTVQDITERKRMEDSLRDSELRYRSLFEQSKDAIAIMEGYPPSFTFVNPAFVDLFGYTEDEVRAMQGAEIWCLVHPEDVDMVRAKLKDRLEGRTRSVRYEFRIQRKDGEIRTVEASGTMIEIAGQMINQSFYRDITEQKRVEKERETLREQFLQSQKMESVGRLAGGVAHDFNNILSVILGYTEMAMDEVEAGGSLHENLTTVYDAARRSADIVRQLLAFSRKQIVQPVTLDLNATIEKMLKMLRRLIGENIDLIWKPTAELPTITIDPSQIDQILANLCVNARDSISDTGKITIETYPVILDEDYCAAHFSTLPGQYVVLSVSDSGSGMDKDVLDKIFEPFFSTKGELGTGLGLATVYGIVKQNNGSINVYSEPGEGTIFRIYLPAATDQAVVDEGENSVLPAGNGETILFVDDDSAILKLSRRLLEYLGYRVLSVQSPNEALRLAQEHGGRIDLLITDVIMPKMNGKELAERVRLCCPGLKVIYMSGYTANVIAHHGILDEGLHFIEKPFTRRKMASTVRAALYSGR
jgi:PAS domain S-box-containing protein